MCIQIPKQPKSEISARIAQEKSVNILKNTEYAKINYICISIFIDNTLKFVYIKFVGRKIYNYIYF